MRSIIPLCFFLITAWAHSQNTCSTPNPDTGIDPINIEVDQHDGNVPCNMMDGNLTTRWSAQGTGRWALFNLGAVTSFDQLEIAFLYSDLRSYTFDIEVSNDGTNFTTVLGNVSSTLGVLGMQTFNFPTQNAQYIRYFGRGNSVNNWNNIMELNIIASSSCTFSNGSTDIPFPAPVVTAGGDSAFSTSVSGGCGLRITNQDTGEPWARANIAIDLAANNIVAGDSLFVSVDATTISGMAAIQFVTDNTANTSLSTSNFSGSSNHTDSFIVPSGISTIDLWLFSNYGQSGNGGEVIFENITVSKSNPNSTGCGPNGLTTEYRIDGTWSSGASSITVSEGTELILSALPNHVIIIDIEDPGGTIRSDNYTFTATAADAGVYTITSNEGCVETLEIIVTGSGDPNWVGSNNGIQYIGNVGIGAAAQANYRLAVDGTIHTREVRVDNDNWPDYVFQDGYELPSLEQVQQHINEHGHLINVPSAEEVAAHGVELGEMNKVLLEKIEELTLYLLEQHKLQAELERELILLENQR